MMQMAMICSEDDGGDGDGDDGGDCDGDDGGDCDGDGVD